MLKKLLAHGAIALSFSAAAFAQDATLFTDADALFAQRDAVAGSAENVLAARAAYQAIVDAGAKDADLVRAVEGIARTYVYQGNVLTPKDTDANKKARKAIFNECVNKALEPISPAKLGQQSAVYFYFRASCMAYEAEVSSVLERLVNLPKLLATFNDGLAAPGGDLFEGGGLKRVKAAVKGNPEAKGLPGGLYDPENALKIVDEAIEAEALPGNAEGFLFCENFYRKIMTLNVLEKKADAQALVAAVESDFTSYLAEGLIPEFIRAETVHCIAETKKLGASL